MAVEDCCPNPTYKGTATKRVCMHCANVEEGPPFRIYYNTETGTLDGEHSPLTPLPRLRYWLLETAMELIQAIARKLQPKYHVGITGSVILKGHSGNDLDLIIYPASSEDQDQEFVRAALSELGLVPRHGVEVVQAAWRKQGSQDQKHVEVWEYRGKKVDLFFLV